MKNAPDLTKRPPRSPRVRLGGYALLPRLIDKGRATLAGTYGEYKYNCPLDQRFFEFVGVDAEAFKQQLAAGTGDKELLDWIRANAKHRRSYDDIQTWSVSEERRAPTEPDSRKHFEELRNAAAAHRKDVTTWFELLDLDDYVSYGGKA
jgi:hypothetical protein